MARMRPVVPRARPIKRTKRPDPMARPTPVVKPSKLIVAARAAKARKGY